MLLGMFVCLAKASFMQDMLLGMFVFFCYLAKASFLQDMLFGMYVGFLYVRPKLNYCLFPLSDSAI
jgi:hypothetical protein